MPTGISCVTSGPSQANVRNQLELQYHQYIPPLKMVLETSGPNVENRIADFM